MPYKDLFMLGLIFLFNTRISGQGEPTEGNDKLHAVFENYYQENLKLDPLTATFAGDHRYDDQLANDGSAPCRRLKDQFDKNTWHCFLNLTGSV